MTHLVYYTVCSLCIRPARLAGPSSTSDQRRCPFWGFRVSQRKIQQAHSPVTPASDAPGPPTASLQMQMGPSQMAPKPYPAARTKNARQTPSLVGRVAYGMWCKYVAVALLVGGSGRPLALAFAQPPTLLNLRNQFFLRQLLRAGQPPGSAEEVISSSSPRQELGFSFSPAGLLFPYHLGVATMLRDQQVITKSTPIGGSSAGALVAALIGSDLSHDKALEACFRINAEWGGASAFVRSFGQGQDLKSLVHDVLDDLLPADAHERINGRPGGVRIAVTGLELNPRRGRLHMMPMFIERFNTREDLIECLLASCMVPFWFTFAPYVSCRGTPAVDGFFSVPPSRFGCPYLPAAKKTVCISPFPASAVRRGVQPPDEAMHTEWLSPEIDPESPLTRFSMRQLLKDALSCSTKEVVVSYFELGRRDALRWLEARAQKVEKAVRAK